MYENLKEGLRQIAEGYPVNHPDLQKQFNEWLPELKLNYAVFKMNETEFSRQLESACKLYSLSGGDEHERELKYHTAVVNCSIFYAVRSWYEKMEKFNSGQSSNNPVFFGSHTISLVGSDSESGTTTRQYFLLFFKTYLRRFYSFLPSKASYSKKPTSKKKEMEAHRTGGSYCEQEDGSYCEQEVQLQAVERRDMCEGHH